MTSNSSFVWKFLNRGRTFFYLLTPSESSFESIEQVPLYINDATLFFITFLILEQIILATSGKKKIRLNDGLVSMTSGVLFQMILIVFRHVEIITYIWVYENFQIFALPWNSAWTWWIAFFTVDLGFYWFHRMAHEINFMWSAHQVHHSSEDYNLTTALRKSVYQTYTSWVFYLPLALFLPPSVFLVHIQLNLLYQFWIHTEIIEKLGPLEWILNTPSHHRVHHGRNRYCIDKNYAGVLIIWDRLFGTFQEEKEEVSYGLTHPINSFDPTWIQISHLSYIINCAWNIKGFGNKLSVFWKGPGWEPGKSRLGNYEDIPEVEKPVERYNPKIPMWKSYFMALHFLVALIAYQELYIRRLVFDDLTVTCFMLYIFLTLTSVGAVLDNRSYGSYLQVISSAVLILGLKGFRTRVTFLSNPSVNLYVQYFLEIYSIVSIVLWLLICARSTIVNIKKVNKSD